MTDSKMLFTCTKDDLGRHVREISSGKIGVVKKDPGNGWIFPSIRYEWDYHADDLEYVVITRADNNALTKAVAALHKIADMEHWTEISAKDLAEIARNALKEIEASR